MKKVIVALLLAAFLLAFASCETSGAPGGDVTTDGQKETTTTTETTAPEPTETTAATEEPIIKTEEPVIKTEIVENEDGNAKYEHLFEDGQKKSTTLYYLVNDNWKKQSTVEYEYDEFGHLVRAKTVAVGYIGYKITEYTRRGNVKSEIHYDNGGVVIKSVEYTYFYEYVESVFEGTPVSDSEIIETETVYTRADKTRTVTTYNGFPDYGTVRKIDTYVNGILTKTESWSTNRNHFGFDYGAKKHGLSYYDEKGNVIEIFTETDHLNGQRTERRDGIRMAWIDGINQPFLSENERKVYAADGTLLFHMVYDTEAKKYVYPINIEKTETTLYENGAAVGKIVVTYSQGIIKTETKYDMNGNIIK